MPRMRGVAVALSVMIACSSTFAGQVAVVNFQKINAVMHFNKIVKARVIHASIGQDKKLIDMSSKISTLEMELRKKAASLSADQQKAMEADIAAKREQFFKLQHEFQIKSLAVYQKENKAIQDNIQQILAAMAEKHHTDIIFTAEGVAYATQKLDLTDELLKELQKLYISQKHVPDD